MAVTKGVSAAGAAVSGRWTGDVQIVSLLRTSRLARNS